MIFEIYEQNELEKEHPFQVRGICTISDVIDGTVSQQDLDYILTFSYPLNGYNYKELLYQRFILCKPDPWTDPQPFRIISEEKNMDGTATFEAEHVSKELINIISDAIPSHVYDDGDYRTENGDVAHAFRKLKDESYSNGKLSKWNFRSDVSDTDDATTTTTETNHVKLITKTPLTVYDILFNGDNSVNGLWKEKGEWLFGYVGHKNVPDSDDYLNVEYLTNRGSDRGYFVMDNSNLLDLSIKFDYTNYANYISPYGYNKNSTNKFQTFASSKRFWLEIINVSRDLKLSVKRGGWSSEQPSYIYSDMDVIIIYRTSLSGNHWRFYKAKYKSGKNYITISGSDDLKLEDSETIASAYLLKNDSQNSYYDEEPEHKVQNQYSLYLFNGKENSYRIPITSENELLNERKFIFIERLDAGAFRVLAYEDENPTYFDKNIDFTILNGNLPVSGTLPSGSQYVDISVGIAANTYSFQNHDYDNSHVYYPYARPNTEKMINLLDEEYNSDKAFELAVFAKIKEDKIGEIGIDATIDFRDVYNKEIPLYLGDTVHVMCEKLNASLKAKVTKVEYDIVNDRYSSIEIGKVKTASTIIATDTVDMENYTQGLFDKLNELEERLANIGG